MKNYILAEDLKHRHSFLKKLLIILPLTVVISAFILMPAYFTINAYNWWYIILMPTTLALITAMIHRRENRKLQYRAVYPLSIDLKKTWISKVVTALIYFSISAVVHMLGVFLLQNILGGQLTANYSFLNLFLASVLLVITNIWQIPFSLFLAKKIGFVASVAGNVMLGTSLGILLSDTSYWIFSPYSWGVRLMVPVMKILPNGLPIDNTNPMVDNTSILIPCALSFGLFIFLTFITANRFSKSEVR